MPDCEIDGIGVPRRATVVLLMKGVFDGIESEEIVDEKENDGKPGSSQEARNNLSLDD